MCFLLSRVIPGLVLVSLGVGLPFGSGSSASFNPPSPSFPSLPDPLSRAVPGHLENSVRWNNDYLDLTIRNDSYAGAETQGNIGLGTSGGDPSNPNDDWKTLLFGWPDFVGTTYTSLWLEGETMKYGDVTRSQRTMSVPPTLDEVSGTIHMIWKSHTLYVAQVTTLVDIGSGRKDTVEITYLLYNSGETPISTGLRIMLDIQVGMLEEIYLHIPGYPSTEFEQDFTGPEIPAYWQGTEGSSSQTGLVSQGTLSGANATPPDRFVIASWGGIYPHVWDYTITPDSAYTPDSAVALWWNPRSIQPGETVRFTTYYGLSLPSIHTPTPGPSPTPFPTVTPSATPTPTPTVDPSFRPPMILAGGYMETDVKANIPSPFRVVMLAYDQDGDLAGVNYYSANDSVGDSLEDNGASGDFEAGDGFFGFEGVYAMFLRVRLLKTARAYDSQGLWSTTWPYLTVSH